MDGSDLGPAWSRSGAPIAHPLDRRSSARARARWTPTSVHSPFWPSAAMRSTGRAESVKRYLVRQRTTCRRVAATPKQYSRETPEHNPTRTSDNGQCRSRDRIPCILESGCQTEAARRGALRCPRAIAGAMACAQGASRACRNGRRIGAGDRPMSGTSPDESDGFGVVVAAAADGADRAVHG